MLNARNFAKYFAFQRVNYSLSIIDSWILISKIFYLEIWTYASQVQTDFPMLRTASGQILGLKVGACSYYPTALDELTVSVEFLSPFP